MCRGATVEVKEQLVWVSSLLYHVGVPGMNSVHQVKYLLPTELSHQALPSQMFLQLARFPLRVPAVAAPSTVKGPDHILCGVRVCTENTPWIDFFSRLFNTVPCHFFFSFELHL